MSVLKSAAMLGLCSALNEKEKNVTIKNSENEGYVTRDSGSLVVGIPSNLENDAPLKHSLAVEIGSDAPVRDVNGMADAIYNVARGQQGLRDIKGKGWTGLVDGGVTALRQKVYNSPDMDDNDSKLAGISAYLDDKTGLSHVTGMADNVKDTYDLLCKHGVRPPSNADDLDRFSTDVVRLLNLPSEDEQEEQQDNSSGKGKGEDGGEGDGSQEPEQSDGSTPGSTDNTGVIQSLMAGGQGCPAGQEEYIEVRMTPPSLVDSLKRKARPSPCSVTQYANNTAQLVRRHIQVVTRATKVYSQTSGRIHRRSLYKVGLPTVGNGDWNRQVFTRKRDGLSIDAAVTILVDGSGSMADTHGGRRLIDMAASCLPLMQEVFTTVLRIPTKVVVFDETSRVTRLSVIKEWDEHVPNIDSATSIVYDQHHTCCNNDGLAVQWCYTDIRKRREKRKIVFVLSDGYPASNATRDAFGKLSQTTGEIQQEGKVDLVALGIGTGAPTKFYKNSTEIQELSHLPDAMLNAVKSLIIK